MKGLIINLVSSGISALVGFLVALLQKSGNPTDPNELVAILVALIILSSISLTLFFNRQRNKFLANQKFDFKFVADPKDDEKGSLVGLYKNFGKKEFNQIGTTPSIVKAWMDENSPNDKYMSAEKFFSSENEILKCFRCRSVRNDQKKGKIFLQVSFVPIDAEGKTIAIERSDVYHPMTFGFKGQRTLSFVSFSPIPPCYCNPTFSIEDVYHNEIPRPWNGYESIKPDFHELGVVVRKNKDAVYMFYVFAAQYPNVHFDKSNNDGGAAVKGLFYENADAYAKGRAFVKDHDKIKIILPVSILQAYARNGVLPKYPANPFSRDFWIVFSQRRFLKSTEIKEVEKAILTEML